MEKEKKENLLKKKIILIIEDERAMSDALKMVLEKDYGIICAYDGAEGLNIVLTQKIDLVLLDINLPKLNGLEVMKEIRGKKGNDFDIIILTNLNDPVMVAEAANYGVFDFLVKTDWKLADVAKVVADKLAQQPNEDED